MIVGFAQDAAPQSCNVEIAQDRMGVRARADQGNWRYIIPSRIQLIAPSRIQLIGTPRSSRGALWAYELQPGNLSLFGDCAPTVGRIFAARYNFIVRNSTGHLAAGQDIALFPATTFAYHWLNEKPHAVLYTTAQTHLLVSKREVVAVDDQQIAVCHLHLCTEDQRQKLTGFVREIADGLAARSVKKLRTVRVQPVDGKLQVDLDVEAAAGRQRLSFKE